MTEAATRSPAMTPNLAAIAERRTPRYTSYPTVPHFRHDVTGGTVAGWLAATPPGTPLSLYLHVPFCRQVCWYCACNMKLAARIGPVLDYADTLAEEIRLVARHLPGAMPVASVHWGGGTPTAMPMAAMGRITDLLGELFFLETGAESAVEIDPRTFEPAMAKGLAAMGIRRASLGVQEFDATVQAAVNRVQPFGTVAATVEALRRAGIGGINFDLMYGLPHQSVETILATVRASQAVIFSSCGNTFSAITRFNTSGPAAPTAVILATRPSASLR